MTNIDPEVAELDKFFSEITIPQVVQIDQATTQNNAPLYAKSNLEMLNAGGLAPLIAQTRKDGLKKLKMAILRQPIGNQA
ncbi:MAG TPA: hypothetical protein VF421_02380 [Niabella sp.]